MSDSAAGAAGDPQRPQLQSEACTAPAPCGDATSAVATDTTPAPPPLPPPTAAPDAGAASVPTLAARPTHGEQEHAAVGTAGSSNGRTVANPFLHAISVVAFDTDAGQKVETVCPPGAVRGVVERRIVACRVVSMLACTASRQANQRCLACTAVQGSVRPTACPRTAAEHLGRQLRHAVFVPGAVVRASHRTLSNASRSSVALTH